VNVCEWHMNAHKEEGNGSSDAQPSEAAELLGIGRTKVYELIRANQLPHRRVGKSIRVPVAQLRAWVEAPAGSEQIQNAHCTAKQPAVSSGAVRQSTGTESPISSVSRGSRSNRVEASSPYG
jgi:excisionase family DNA binding protein